MKVSPIINPIKGERVVGINPEITLFPTSDWRRRLNNYVGRTLTHRALIAEQQWRNGRLRSMGKLLAPGVVSGLQIRYSPIETVGEGLQTNAQLYLSPGQAISRLGEVITVTRPATLLLDDVYVFNHDRHIEQSAGEDIEKTAFAEQLPTLADELNIFGGDEVLPRVGILVLQPLFAEINVAEESDPCELDPSAYAYENWQLLDACRLVLYTWPESWLPLPAVDDQWRNRVAHSIFAKERELSADEFHPWQALGVPIAIIGFDEDWQVQFVDRNSVVRYGGGEPSSGDSLQGEGNPYLWQAQFQQFNEHLAQRLKNLAKGEEAIPVAEQLFRFLPPVGILPKNFAQPRKQMQEFFPVNYRCDARVIPYQQLDLVLRESTPLLPFDVQVPDQVEILVPVQQNHFEPRLLHTEMLDIIFDETVKRFTFTRNNWLGRRSFVRRRAAAIFAAIYGRPLTYPDPDPDRIDDLELADPVESGLIEMGQVWRFFPGTQAPPASWNQSGFDDTSWQSGATGLGYGKVDFATELEDMRGAFVSVFCRKEFLLDESSILNHLNLSVITSGGYTVYLNGVQIHQHNVDSTDVNALATRIQKLLPVDLSLEPFRARLNIGINTLAIAVHNTSRGAQYFLFAPRLTSIAALANYTQFDIDEEKFGVDRVEPPEDDAGDAFSPKYAVEKFAGLQTYLTENAPPLNADDVATLDTEGLEQFIAYLQRKIDLANDKIDFGFVRLQTDIYRVRQFVLGNTEGTKLATSPILASIARGETAYSTKKELATFIENLNAPADSPALADGATDDARPSRSSAAFSSALGDAFVSGDLLAGADVTEGRVLGRGIRSVDIEERSKEDLVLSRGGTVSAGGKESLLFRGTRSASIEEIQGQTAIIGATSQYHNVTIAERLEEPIATASKTAGIATKAEVLLEIANVGINVSDLQVPGFRDAAGLEINRSFKDIVDGNLIAEILNGDHDTNRRDDAGNELLDESAFFNSGVRALENTVVVLRKVEGRIHAYKRVVKHCKEVMAELQVDIRQADMRLKEIDIELAEARHDLSIARELREEELARITAINERRDAILENYVPFLLFRRPRFTDTHLEAPVHFLNPHVEELDRPECDVDGIVTPQELNDMMDLVRDAPLRWFVIADKVLDELTRLEDMQIVAKDARDRAKKTKSVKQKYKMAGAKSKYEHRIHAIYHSFHAKVSDEKRQLRELDFAQYYQLGWQETRQKVKKIISLGDLIDSDHGKMAANKLAAQELKSIVEILTCLYHHFDGILPAIRLNWAERLSQYDVAVSLRNLSSLPRWGDVPYLERKAMQPLVDWLFTRFSSSYIDAVLLVDDLIRMALLLASHAPVEKIIAGQVEKNITVETGKTVDIAVADIKEVEIGMQVMVQGTGRTVWKGRIEDIVAGQVKAIVTDTSMEGLLVEENTTVQIKKSKGSRKKSTRKGKVREKQRGRVKATTKVSNQRPSQPILKLLL